MKASLIRKEKENENRNKRKGVKMAQPITY
jgi:hypothetical protein